LEKKIIEDMKTAS